MEKESQLETPMSDDEFKHALLAQGAQLLPESWLETWANQLVISVPVEMRQNYLRSGLEPGDLIADISDQEIDRGL